MDNAQQNLISCTSNQAKAYLALYELTRENDTLYNGVPNWAALITQEQIDSVPSFKAVNLTVAQVASVIYACKMINTQIDTIDLPAFVTLARL